MTTAVQVIKPHLIILHLIHIWSIFDKIDFIQIIVEKSYPTANWKLKVFGATQTPVPDPVPQHTPVVNLVSQQGLHFHYTSTFAKMFSKSSKFPFLFLSCLKLLYIISLKKSLENQAVIEKVMFFKVLE